MERARQARSITPERFFLSAFNRPKNERIRKEAPYIDWSSILLGEGQIYSLPRQVDGFEYTRYTDLNDEGCLVGYATLITEDDDRNVAFAEGHGFMLIS